MLKIAICASNISICNDIENFIEKYSITNNTYIYIDKIYNKNELIENIISGEEYDLLFLYYHPKLDDTSILGNYIRKELNNQSVSIVYVSEVVNDTIKLFSSQPLDFIQLPVTEEKIFNIFNSLENIRNDNKLYLKIKNGINTHFIPYKDILYITSQSRQLIIVTEKENHICYGKISELNKINGFVKVHKSFIINLNYIRNYNYKSIELTNGAIIPISQSLRPQIKKNNRSFITYSYNIDLI